jgi:hypothetical protein
MNIMSYGMRWTLRLSIPMKERMTFMHSFLVGQSRDYKHSRLTTDGSLRHENVAALHQNSCCCWTKLPLILACHVAVLWILCGANRSIWVKFWSAFIIITTSKTCKRSIEIIIIEWQNFMLFHWALQLIFAVMLCLEMTKKLFQSSPMILLQLVDMLWLNCHTNNM